MPLVIKDIRENGNIGKLESQVGQRDLIILRLDTGQNQGDCSSSFCFL